MNNSEETILIMTFKVRQNAEKDFAIWQEKLNAQVANFPGFVSLEMMPIPKTDLPTWKSVQRFKKSEALNTWYDSEEKRRLLEEVKPLLRQEVEEIRESEFATGQKSSVTEVFVTHIKPGQHNAYRAWASKIQQVEAQFPGYLGVYIQAPSSEEKGNWITILRFDSRENLDNWLNSEKRKEVLKEAESMVAQLESHRVVSPFASWFADISKASGVVPPLWKQTMLILLVLFPIVMLELKFLNPITKSLNSSVANFIGNAISVTLISWPAMPLCLYFLGWWLRPETNKNFKKTSLGTLLILALYCLEIIVFWNFL